MTFQWPLESKKAFRLDPLTLCYIVIYEPIKFEMRANAGHECHLNTLMVDAIALCPWYAN